jgi:high frequency lysogenization protein
LTPHRKLPKIAAMQHTLAERTLALAALFQAAQLVQHVARRGQAANSDVETTLGSLFHIDADNTESIFGSTSALTTGLRALLARLGTDGNPEELEVTRYVVALLHLERKLVRQPTMLETLRIGIERIRNQLNYFPVTHGTIVAALSELYQATLSTLQPRIMVQGEPAYLADKGRASQIRALLLAGIRAAVLWRQLGGSRWQLFIGRRRILESAQNLLQS